ncbi:Phosphoribosyl-AMP cyclohydrolase [uncultured archaeon]|nr:Phosphoribosyl-AMP cyclohydrolase [uncultured archaeon]
MIIPSIDLMAGKAVQLRQGNPGDKALERENVKELALEFSKYGEVAVIDLDAAFGRGDNLALVKELCARVPCRVGGGIRRAERANELLAAGAKKLIIGTKAEPEFLKQLPKDRLLAAIDTKKGEVVSEGWVKGSGQGAEERIRALEPYVSGFLFTNVDKEGLMGGLDWEAVQRVRGATKLPLTVAGGITSSQDIRKLEDMGCDSQLGMALYSGKIKLEEAFVSLVKFDASSRLVPTIVQDERGQVLMLAYSNPESLQKTFATGQATYYSRSRQSLWTKGETSGTRQEFQSARWDCDRDTLLFVVKQTGAGACHTGRYSCFGEQKFGFEELYATLCERMANPTPNSYTAKISANEKLIKEKLLEEAGEVAEYKDRENLVWELADLSYFMLVLMAKKGITPNEVRNELHRRRK